MALKPRVNVLMSLGTTCRRLLRCAACAARKEGAACPARLEFAMTQLYDQVQEAVAAVRGRRGATPLTGPTADRLGPRFPDMCRPYDRELLDAVRRIALEEKIVLQQGVFVAVPGPNLETRAEYRFLRGAGADVVGMSTVPEVIVAVHEGMKTLGLSIITDLCLPDALEPARLEDIIAVANEAEKKLRVLVRRVVGELD